MLGFTYEPANLLPNSHKYELCSSEKSFIYRVEIEEKVLNYDSEKKICILCNQCIKQY